MASAAEADGISAREDMVYFNGIDADTGTYAVPPMSIQALARCVRAGPELETQKRPMRAGLETFAPVFGKDLTAVGEVGWGVIFHADTAQAVRDALAPLIEHRRKQAGELLKVLDYKKGEQLRDWYIRHQIGFGTLEVTAVPYYLLLVGSPAEIPFEFQYLLGLEYAVGRLAFDTPDDYARYANSIASYETVPSVANTKQIVYWGTRHLGDPATNLSASQLIEPLANGIPSAQGYLKKPVQTAVGYSQKLYLGDEATRQTLLSTLHGDKPPAVMFTASHGMSLKSGRPAQSTDNGGLLCQEWPGFGTVKREHYLTGADVADDANVSGMVAFIFACFGGGTPDTDQFLMDLSQAGKAPPLAPQPFVAALPRRLLAHPRGSALAVIAHVDRAWGFSIKPPKINEPQIGPFYNGLGWVMDGSPIGHVIAQQFGQRYSALAAVLLNAISPTALAGTQPSDRDLVNYWLECNDARNYVVLGDPAARIRNDAFA
jgi:hypothetical protein